MMPSKPPCKDQAHKSARNSKILMTSDVRATGLLFLGVPFGADAVVFNAHRIYGPIRLPMLTSNFVVVGVVTSATMRHLNQLWGDVPGVSSSQPVAVLQNSRDQPCRHSP